MEDNFKYNDVAALLTDLCKGYSNDELVGISKLAARMKKDNEFRMDYQRCLRARYIRAIPQIQKGMYEKVSFSVLNREILSLVDGTPIVTNARGGR